MSYCGAVPVESPSFSHYCAAVYGKLQSAHSYDELFSEFTHYLVRENAHLSAEDWETAAFLVRHYVSSSRKRKNPSISKACLQEILAIPTLPSYIREDIHHSWQKLNPHDVSLGDLIRQFHRSDFQETFDTQLLFQLYEMTLHSAYEERKQELLLARDRGEYDRAIQLCHALTESIASGECAPHEAVCAIEEHFIKKTLLSLNIAQSLENKELCEDLLLPYCRAEQEYIQAIERLVHNIANGNVQRAHEIDSVLLSYALYTLPWDPDGAIQELEVLIDHGHYLPSALSHYAYFTLLDLYHQRKDTRSMSRLLSLGRSVFVSTHAYFPEYAFFLGCYEYEQGNYARSKEAFSSVLPYATKLGVTLARTYEYLGCLLYRERKHEEAEEYFLRSYKGWGRQEARLGLLFMYAIQGKRTEYDKVYSQEGFSLSYQGSIRDLNVITMQESGFVCSEVMQAYQKWKDEGSLSDLYYHCICDMVKKKRERESQDPVLSLICGARKHSEYEHLLHMSRSVEDAGHQNALRIWHMLYQGVSSDVYDFEKGSLAYLTLCCYRALYQEDARSGEAIVRFFSEDDVPLQSIIRCVWLETRSTCTQGDWERCYRGSPQRLYGDYVYFLAYDHDQYLSCDKAAQHLSEFPEHFPHSSLLPFVYYIQSRISSCMVRKIGWLIKARHAIKESTLEKEWGYAWARVYSLIMLDLAEAYLSCENFVRAKDVLEEMRTDWEQSLSFHMLSKEERQECISMEMLWVQGLARVYDQLGERENLIHHLMNHIEKSLLRNHSRREYGGVLRETLSLCECVLS